MIIALLKKQFTKNKLLLKIQACILSILLWSHLSNFHTVTKTYTVPLSFYNGNLEDFDLSALPEEVVITVRGSRFDLAKISSNSLAVHIDLAVIPTETRLMPSSQHLFLPEKVSVIDCIPSPLYVKRKTKT